jgi:putative ABC transport system permease protein
MKLGKTFKHALNMVLHSRLRSWLTILGIVIGVASVIAIVSLGQSLQSSITSSLSGLGGDIVTVSPGAARGGDFGPGRVDREISTTKATSKAVILDTTDYQVLKGIPEILYVQPQIRGNVNVSYLGKAGSVSVTGVDQKVWALVTTSTMAQGRFLDSADQNVVVIGGRLASSYFSQPVGINKMLTVEGGAFRVVGILNDQSTSIYMPIQMAFTVIPNKVNNQYDSIVLKIKDQDFLDDDLAIITQKLTVSRHVTNRTMDFSVTSQKEQQATRAAALSTMTTFLVAIAAVSLLVGAVGIANTMFTSVLEKTKEIGIMKAIGARNQDILLIFIFNSAIIGLIGGLIGVILGGIMSYFLPSLLSSGIPFVRGNLLTVVSLNSVFMALGVSVGVGIIAGIVPAYQASKLKPVDALRFE